MKRKRNRKIKSSTGVEKSKGDVSLFRAMVEAQMNGLTQFDTAGKKIKF